MISNFKFFSTIKTRNRREHRLLNNRTRYNHFSYIDLNARGNEMNTIFIWDINDTRSNQYRVAIYQGYIKDFIRTYDDMIIEDDEILFMFPTIRSISIMSDFTNIPVGTNYNFTNPDEIVTIFYKIYTR